ncbi:MAG: GTPase HflX [Oscillospiraceae bacterium]|nr:GTPase HflX [Oscillospiraceae bacterium]
MFENTKLKDKVITVCVDTGEYDAERSMDELSELVDTAGGEVVARVIQRRPSFDPGTCIGSGRLEELSQLCEQTGADRIIFDHELTATQIRNIEDACNTFTIDRTMLILDIFAQRATTREGRLQVELAQNKYRLPRLAGMGVKLSRLGGGIGTRGPGETKLETDRRHIRSRISALSEELKEIEKRRGYARAKRKKDNVLTCAIVGYTNVGKSTLLNKLTEAGVLAENKLFATLETTSRAIELPDGRSVTLIDTVGLISRLPHQLVEAFKSTLEEAASADVILHLCDASADNCEEQADVTIALLKELGCDGIPIVTVLNKCDLVPYIDELDTKGSAVKISAKSGEGIANMLLAISKALEPTAKRMNVLLPYDKAGLVNKILIDGKVFSQEYGADGILVDALIDNKILHLFENYKA